jgi:hypothetical protein
MWVIECAYDGPDHEFPDDQQFGGANGLHPGADPRWKPSVYEYYDDQVRIIETTCAPLCDDQAIDEFTKVAAYGPGFNPVWLSVRRPDGEMKMLATYDKATDVAKDV